MNRSVTELGIDVVCDMLLKAGAKEVTRDDWISLSYLGSPPDVWTAEHESELPVELQDFSAVTSSRQAD